MRNTPIPAPTAVPAWQDSSACPTWPSQLLAALEAPLMIHTRKSTWMARKIHGKMRRFFRSVPVAA